MRTFNWIDKHVKERFNSNFHLDKADAPTRVYIMALCKYLDYMFYGLDERNKKECGINKEVKP